MVSLMAAAREQGLKEIEGSVLHNNHGMLKLMTDLGFSVRPAKNDPQLRKVSKLL